MAVYNPSGSGNVHVDKAISGGKGKGQTPPKQAKKVTATKKKGK